MSELIRVPDIGSGEGEIIELFVKVSVTPSSRPEHPDPGIGQGPSMEIPAPKAGVVKSLKVKLGDLTAKRRTAASDWKSKVPLMRPAAAALLLPRLLQSLPLLPRPLRLRRLHLPPKRFRTFMFPDIGSSGKAKIIELLVKVSDTVEADQSLITLESNKASMEIPSPAAGVKVKHCRESWKTEVGTGVTSSSS